METIAIVLGVLAIVLVWVVVGEVLWLVDRRARRREREQRKDWWKDDRS